MVSKAARPAFMSANGKPYAMSPLKICLFDDIFYIIWDKTLDYDNDK